MVSPGFVGAFIYIYDRCWHGVVHGLRVRCGVVVDEFWQFVSSNAFGFGVAVAIAQT